MQHARIPYGSLREALDAGLDVHTLATLAGVATYASGHAEGVALRTATIARRVGRSARTVQRHVRALERYRPAELSRRRRRVAPRRHRASVYRIAQPEPGTPYWTIPAAVLEAPAWHQASSAQRGILIYLRERVGRSWCEITIRALAAGAGVGASTLRHALAYWRDVGWIETQTHPGQASGWRCELPGEPDAIASAAPSTAEREQARLAPIARWCGLEIARQHVDDPGTWPLIEAAAADYAAASGTPSQRLATAAAADQVVGRLRRYLDHARAHAGYRHSRRRTDLARALGVIVARRPIYDDEIAEERLRRELASAGAPPGAAEHVGRRLDPAELLTSARQLILELEAWCARPDARAPEIASAEGAIRTIERWAELAESPRYVAALAAAVELGARTLRGLAAIRELEP